VKLVKKILLCFALLAFITACSNSHDDNSANITLSAVPAIEPTVTSNNDNDPTPVKVDADEQSKISTEDINPNAKDITSLVPTGWHILESSEPVKAEGDLNKDGILDVAIIIEKTPESIDDTRSLLIAFGTKDHTFSLSIIAENVVLPVYAGGGFGDPFNGISIDRGSVVVSDFGGSDERWYHKYRFRFQDDDWYLIGATMGTNFLINEEIGMGNDEDDYNLLTGDFNSRRTDDTGEVKITNGNRGKKKLIKLREFDTNQI
jgi:hypothetical protein